MKFAGGLFVILAALAASTAAYASGRVPKFESKRPLESHAACLAELQKAYDAHRAMVSPRKELANGSTQEITLSSETDGVKIISPSEARYEGRIWWHNGSSEISRDGNREVSHSWDEDILSCDGEVLTSGGAGGYTLSSFEPVSGETIAPRFELRKIRKKRNRKPRR
jgi:hypothetical protein